MEEKKQKLDKLVEDYSYNRIPYEVFDNCLKQLYVDKQIGENNPSLKEFDLEAAKAGKHVCTRDGRKARIICFDRKDIKPIVALVTSINGDNINEKALYYFEDGHHLSKYDNNINDLMMLPEKKEGWAVIRRSDIYETEEQAKEVLLNSRVGVMIRKIEWEE